MFSKSCEYGLRAVIFIAQQSTQSNKVGLATIAEEIDSPQAFTAKILQQLTKNNVIKSIKGPYGGFVIEEDRMNTRLSEIVKILDGDTIFTGCALGLKACNANAPCPLHFKFVAIREELKQMLENTSLKALAKDMDSDLLKLK